MNIYTHITKIEILMLCIDNDRTYLLYIHYDIRKINLQKYRYKYKLKIKI